MKPPLTRKKSLVVMQGSSRTKLSGVGLPSRRCGDRSQDSRRGKSSCWKITSYVMGWTPTPSNSWPAIWPENSSGIGRTRLCLVQLDAAAARDLAMAMLIAADRLDSLSDAAII